MDRLPSIRERTCSYNAARPKYLGQGMEDHMECGIIPPSFDSVFEDASPCSHPCGHGGPHQTITRYYGSVSWKTDMECDCSDCQKDEPADWCIVWWPDK